jgi:uncharacterized protein
MMNNKVILGTVQMGLPYGISNPHGKILMAESHKILDYAFMSGIRLLDTAESYGNAHEVIGDYHALNPDKKFSVITKVSPGKIIKTVEKEVEKYLHDLKIDELECFMFHSYNSYRNNLDVIPRLKELKRNGIVNQIGVSIYTNDELKTLILEDAIDSIQLPFNLLDNYSIRGKLLEQAKKKGKIIYARSAFLQGLFFKNYEEKSILVQALRSQLTEIDKLSRLEGVAIAQLALAYCIQQSSIDQVLIGVDSISQLKSNLTAASYQISEKVILLINQIRTQNTTLLNPSLWKESDIGISN